MMLKSFVVSAIAGAVMALPEPVAEPAAQYEVLQIRQVASSLSTMGALPTDAGTLSSCLPPANILSIVTSFPTPASEIIEILATVTNPCSLPAVTGSLSAPYYSYSSQISSWFSQYSSPILSWQSEYSKNCPIASGLNVDVCSTFGGSGATTSGSSGTRTGSSTGTGTATRAASSGASGAASTGAAANNMASFGAAAVAGFAGVVAML